MTRKEFIERMDEVFSVLENKNYAFYSCPVVSVHVSTNAWGEYRNYIKLFTANGLFSHQFGYGYEERICLRMLLLQSFKEEVLSTRKYLEF